MILDFEEYNNNQNQKVIQVDVVLNCKKYVIIGKVDNNQSLTIKCNSLYDNDKHISEENYAEVFMLLSRFQPISENYFFQLSDLRKELQSLYFWEIKDV